MATQSSTAGGYRLLAEEANPLRAYLIAGLLEEAGIPRVVEEDNLADEFSMSRKLMNTQGTRVLVPAERLEEARLIFLAMSQPIPVIDDDDPELVALEQKYNSRKNVALTAIVFALIGAPIFGMLIYWVADRWHWLPS